ncbi:tryptophan-rich sensory protein [Sinomonas atrocyanea]|uniref:tryptophan-rich sensory protein n=1 Tax=Sinomonas atrocyanea TaxID=37927 RepID=UPI003D953789
MKRTDLENNSERTASWTAASLTAASAVAALALASLGSGAFGGVPVQDAAGGYLSSTATPVAPAPTAFAIWSVVYLGLLAYAVWQLLPAGRRSRRQRAIRPWAAASMLLNAAWLWASQLGSLPATLVVMLALLAVLVRIAVLQWSVPPGSRAEAIASDGTFGLYLGWICVATVANTASLLGWALGIRPGDPAPSLPGGIPAEVAAAVVLAVAAAVGVGLALRGGWAPLVAIAWGLAWIAAARLNGPLAMPTVGIAAGAAAAVVLAAGLLARFAPSRGLRTRAPREAHA